LNSVAGPVNTIFGKIYPTEYPKLPTTPLVPSIVFAGLVVGQLVFGYISDKCGRRVGMVAATILVILFSALCAGSWHRTLQGMMIVFTIFRFCLGVGIGAEYPAGSVAASEATAEANPGRRHGLFIMVTNFVIDFGFVLGNIIPCVLVVLSSSSFSITSGNIFRETLASRVENRGRLGLSSTFVSILLPIQNGGARTLPRRWNEECQYPICAGHQNILEATLGCRRDMVLIQLFGVSIQCVLELYRRYYFAS